MPLYHERLWASGWTFLACALVIPAILIVFLPISMTAGMVIAVLVYAACVVSLVVTSPVVVVTAEELLAGRAHIEKSLLGTAEVFGGNDAFLERGQRLDARAWLLLRGGIGSVVKVPVNDSADPAPYWLISSRRPEELAAVLNR